MHSLVTGLQAEPRNPAPRAKRQHYGCINNIMGTDNQHKVKHRECLQSFQHAIIIYHNYKYVTAERWIVGRLCWRGFLSLTTTSVMLARSLNGCTICLNLLLQHKCWYLDVAGLDSTAPKLVSRRLFAFIPPLLVIGETSAPSAFQWGQLTPTEEEGVDGKRRTAGGNNTAAGCLMPINVR